VFDHVFYSPSSVGAYFATVSAFVGTNVPYVSTKEKRELLNQSAFALVELMMREYRAVIGYNIKDVVFCLNYEETLSTYDLSRSAGYDGGTKAFYERQNSDTLHDDFYRCLSGELVPEVYSLMVPKSEYLKHEKKNVKERIIFVMNLLALMYVKSFTHILFTELMVIYKRHCCFIGFCRFYSDYHELYRRLSFCRIVFGIDLSGQEYSNHEDMQESLWESRTRMAPAEMHSHFRKFARMIGVAEAIDLDGNFWKIMWKTLSGGPTTLVDNTWASIIVFVAVNSLYFRVTPRQFLSLYRKLWDGQFVGDDALVGFLVNLNWPEYCDHLRRCYWWLGYVCKLTEPSDTPYGLEFCGATILREGDHPVSTKPEKVVATLLTSGNTAEKFAEVLGGIEPVLKGSRFETYIRQLRRETEPLVGQGPFVSDYLMDELLPRGLNS
jgi:hypothetical protein